MDMPGHLAEVDANPLLLACMAACEDCQRVLSDAAGGGIRCAAVPALRRQMLDCAELCAATANYARAGSVFLPEVVAACVRLCDECGAAIEALPRDATLDDCAEACRRCARACFALTRRIGRRSTCAPRPSAA